MVHSRGGREVGIALHSIGWSESSGKGARYGFVHGAHGHNGQSSVGRQAKWASFVCGNHGKYPFPAVVSRKDFFSQASYLLVLLNRR